MESRGRAAVAPPGGGEDNRRAELAQASPGNSGERGCQVRGVVVSPLGMGFDPRFDFEEWRQLGARIAMRANASLWWLGDWLAFGQDKYGRRYREALALTGLDYQTLRNYAVVARRFDLSRRRDKLSFQHHAELSALDDEDQDRWLAQAESAGWSRNELRRRVRRQLADRSPAPSPVRLVLDEGRRALWQQAALREECDLEAWMVRTLDEAAAAFDPALGA